VGSSRGGDLGSAHGGETVTLRVTVHSDLWNSATSTRKGFIFEYGAEYVRVLTHNVPDSVVGIQPGDILEVTGTYAYDLEKDNTEKPVFSEKHIITATKIKRVSVASDFV
jgi:hypothetical protein